MARYLRARYLRTKSSHGARVDLSPQTRSAISDENAHSAIGDLTWCSYFRLCALRGCERCSSACVCARGGFDRRRRATRASDATSKTPTDPGCATAGCAEACTSCSQRAVLISTTASLRAARQYFRRAKTTAAGCPRGASGEPRCAGHCARRSQLAGRLSAASPSRISKP